MADRWLKQVKETESIKLVAASLLLLMVVSFTGCVNTKPGITPNISPAASQNTSTSNQSLSQRTPPSGSPGLLQRTGASSNNSIITVNGNGIIMAANYANLYFGTGGKIGKISVKEGDHANKGTELAKLNSTSLEAALAQARVALDQAELAQTQAKTSLGTAQFTLDKIKAVSGINDQITTLQWEVKICEAEMQGNPDNIHWGQQMALSQLNLAYQKEVLAALLGKSDNASALAYVTTTYDSSIIQDVRMKKLQVESAQQSVDKSEDAIEQARQNVVLAQEQLDQATITAPFDGIIASLNFREGDIVSAPTLAQYPIIYFVDTSTMELKISVNELDIPKVKIGQRANIGIDAFPGVKIEGTVEAISPAPTITGKMVTYDVTIAFLVPLNMEVKVGMNATAQIIVD